jgi:D-serine dehydratase
MDVSRLEWNLLNEDVSLPAAVLYADRIEHNLKWMQAFVAEYGVKLAPHGKTTMAPQLFRRQLETGAWGITLATAHQVRAAYHGGVSRILMANQLVGRRNMLMIAEMLSDPDFEFFCLVDSVEGVEQLGKFFSSVRKSLNVLLELGVPGGRTGVRDDAQRNAVLEAIARYPDALKLAGVELYEGVLKEEPEVREFLQSAVAITRAHAGDSVGCRLGMVRRGCGRIREGVRGRQGRGGAAPRLLSDSRCRGLSEGTNGYLRTQPGRQENGRRTPAGAATMGLCAVDSRAGPRHHRPG